MSFIDPLARSLEHFVYDRICALSALLSAERGASPGPDTLASPLVDIEANRRR